MADCAARLADAVDVPVFADGDTGHGNVTNVARTMRLFEHAGIAAVFFEDQVAPKRCGHMAGKQVVEPAEMVARIRAAVDARVDADLIVMARTDALAIHGIDDAIRPHAPYLEAGADMAFIEAPRTVDEMRRIRPKSPREHGRHGPGRPYAGFSRRPNSSTSASPALPIPPPSPTPWPAPRKDLLEHLHRHGTTAGIEDRMMQFDEFHSLIGLADLRAREDRLSSV